MQQARIIFRSLPHPSGEVAEWYEIETIHGDRTHRSSDRSYKSHEEAVLAAKAEGYEIVD